MGFSHCLWLGLSPLACVHQTRVGTDFKSYVGKLRMEFEDPWVLQIIPRGSTYTTIRELGPIIPYKVWYFGA